MSKKGCELGLNAGNEGGMKGEGGACRGGGPPERRRPRCRDTCTRTAPERGSAHAAEQTSRECLSGACCGNADAPRAAQEQTAATRWARAARVAGARMCGAWPCAQSKVQQRARAPQAHRQQRSVRDRLAGAHDAIRDAQPRVRGAAPLKRLRRSGSGAHARAALGLTRRNSAQRRARSAVFAARMRAAC